MSAGRLRLTRRPAYPRAGLLGAGLLGQGGAVGGQGYRWTAPTYRLDSSGRAYNVPAVTGSELLTNGAFASDTAWTKGAGWSIGSGVASRSGTAAQSNLTQAPAIDRYKLYRLIYTLTALSAGSTLGLVQGGGVGARKTALGTYTAWARLGQSTTYGVQAVANSVLSIDNASLYAVDMDTALAMLEATEEVDRVGVAFADAPVDDAMMLIMASGAANSLYNCILAAIFQHTDETCRVRLFKVVDGVPSATIGSDETITFVAGAKLEIRRSGTTYTIYYNGAATTATGTITDASIVNNDFYGFCTLGSTRTSGFWLNGRRVPLRFSKWWAPFWSVDAGGAFAEPTLGSEALANGSFAADSDWTKGTGWTIAGGVGVGSTATGTLNQAAAVDGGDYVLTFDLISRTGGALRTQIGGTAQGPYTVPGSYMVSGRAGGTNLGFAVATNFSGTVDNASAKPVTGNEHAAIRGQPDQIGIRLAAWAYNQSVRLRWGIDDLANPANYIEFRAFTNSAGTSAAVIAAKVVAGAQATLISSTDIAFVADGLLEMRRTATNTFQFWYGGSQVGTDQTVSDAAILAGLYCGMVMLCDGWRVTEFQMDGAAVPFRF